MGHTVTLLIHKNGSGRQTKLFSKTKCKLKMLRILVRLAVRSGVLLENQFLNILFSVTRIILLLVAPNFIRKSMMAKLDKKIVDGRIIFYFILERYSRIFQKWYFTDIFLVFTLFSRIKYFIQ